MTNKEFLLEVQKSCHLEMPRCLMLMGSLQKMLGNAAVDQIPVALSGLGIFTSHKHPEYVQEDSQTGAMTLYPPRITYHMQSEQSAEGTPCEQLLAEYAHVDVEETAPFVSAVVKTIEKYLQAGEEIEVPGIGTFKHVLTHQSDLQHVEFLPCDQMKELVNAPFACFESVEISPARMEMPQVEVATEKIEEEIIEEEMEEVIPRPVAEMTENVEETEPVEETGTVEDNVEEETPSSKDDDTMKEEDTMQTAEEEEKTESPVAQAEKPVAAPIISIHKDGHIMIKDGDDKSEDKSVKRLMYVSLSLIMAACAALLWLMFGDEFGGEPPVEAKIVEAAPVNEKPVVAATEKTEKVEVEAKEEVKKQVDEKPAAPEKVEEVKQPVVETQPVAETKPVLDTKPVVKEAPVKSEAPAKTGGFHRMKDANGNEVKVTLEPGSRLTLIALEHFGDKAFWPYIYDVNSDKLKAPNLVQSGMVLYLPDPAFYGIDAKDPASLQKAKNRAAQLLK